MATEDRFWPARLRWRLRGAWQWPAFAVLTIADAFVLHELPPVQGGVDLVPGLIISSFANLFLIGAVAPWLARRVAARQAGTAPTEVLGDRIATGLLCAATAGLIAAGLAARPVIVSETEATEENARAVRAFILSRGPEEARRNLDTANTVRLADGFFRTCVARDDRRRAYCFFADTNRDPTRVRPDPNPAPNSALYPVPRY